ncbi:MAG TPA: alpha/beta fold hydrolase [Candidatus Limnocylindria bacterium]
MSRSQAMAVQAGEATLAGTLTLPDLKPEAAGRVPAALLLPSWLPRTRDGAWDRAGHASWFAPTRGEGPGLLARLAEALGRHGVASLRCDPRGCGESDGAWEAVSLFTRIDDARDMLAAMRSHGSLDLRRFAIAGHGEGATLALSVAIGDPAVSALTLIGPSARSWRDVLRRGVAERARTGTDLEHALVAALDRVSEELLERAERREATLRLHLRRGDSAELQLAWVEQSIHTPPLALATMLHRSVGLVHGLRDAWSDAEESALLEIALRDAGNQPSRRLLPNAGHDLAEADDGVIDQIAADLAARITAVELPPVLVAIEEMGGDLR